MNQNALAITENTRLWIYVISRTLCLSGSRPERTVQTIEAIPDTEENQRRIDRRKRDKTIVHIGAFGGIPPTSMASARQEIEATFTLLGADITLPWRIIGRE